MSKAAVHNLSWMPIFVFGAGSIYLGLRWLVHPEPWLLDQIPNEILIQKSFEELFQSKINFYLPDYLKVIYLFLGWCAIGVGMLIIIYVDITRMGTFKSRLYILSTLLIFLVGFYYLIFNYIPLTPFKKELYLMSLLWFISAFFSLKLRS